jgi:hypothetical protein
MKGFKYKTKYNLEFHWFLEQFNFWINDKQKKKEREEIKNKINLELTLKKIWTHFF